MQRTRTETPQRDRDRSRRTRTETPQSNRKAPQSDRDRSRTTAAPLRGFSDKIPGQEKPTTSVEPNVSFAPPEGVDPKAPKNLLLAAASRNEVRLKVANLADEDTLLDSGE
jgi:hypothetical protein